jgi:hypothetical protein
MLLTLIAIILFTTFGQAFDSQHNNKDIFQYDSRGKQRAKEMLHSDQGNFYMNPLKSETNGSSAFEQLSVPIPHDGPAHFKQLPVLNNGPAIISSSFLQLPNDSPAKQHPVPNDDSALTILQFCIPMTIISTGLQASYNRHSILNDVTETSIWHQAFDNTLSYRPIMNV